MSVVKQWGAEITVSRPPSTCTSTTARPPCGPRARARCAGARRRRHVLRHRDPGADALAAIAWDRLLLDEAQDVKNPATKRARALRRLQARRKVAMTGTPIENRLSELWAIMDIVNPGLLGSREGFDRGLRAADRAVRRRGGAGTAARDRRSVRAPPREGLAGDRARAAADHDREGLLPPDRGAGEPLPRNGRPVDGPRRGARGSLRPPRRRARDARPPEAGLQPPRDAADHRPPARRPLRQARASRTAARPTSRPATSRSSSRSTPASTASLLTSRNGSAAASGSSTAA